MQKHLIVLPDGTEIGSGTSGAAVMAVSLSYEVNNSLLIAPGAASAAMLQLTLLSAEPLVQTGDTLLLKNADTGALIGTFLAQEPVLSGGLEKITAYDRMILLDKEIAPCLAAVSWPCSLYDLAVQVTEFCGLQLKNTAIPCGDFPVPCPTGDGITGRQILMWIAQAAGCFCRITPEGELELDWYTPSDLEVAPEAIRCLSGVINLTGKLQNGVLSLSGSWDQGVLTLAPRQYALSGGLTLENSQICPIDRVQIRQSESDVGFVYPDAPGENTLVIQGNPLLAAENAQMLLPVAESLYDRFRGITYTPGTLKLPTTEGLSVGQIIRVTDSRGTTHSFYVMGLRREVSGDTVSCTGSVNRDSATVVNNRSYRNLQGRVLQLRTDVDGIRAENSDNRGKLSALTLNVDTIRGSVSSQQAQGDLLTQRLTTLEQTATGLQLSVETIETQGATKLKTAMGYTFDDEGLRIARTGQPMENCLDNTGMRVLRSGQPILQADHKGVLAQDVTVKNYLVVGNHARFEDYLGGRTGCFWLEG